MPDPSGRELAVLWDDRFLEYEFGPEHPFTERSRRLAVELLRSRGAFGRDGLRLIDAIEPAPEHVLREFHGAEYLRRLAAVSAMEDPPLLDGGDTPGFPGCYGAAARLVGGTLAAERQVRDQGGAAFQPGGGLHHAAPQGASGFCILNDIAVTIAHALRERRYHRIAYLDIDAHQGDGVMYGFYGEGRVLAIDVHQDGRTLFPGTGAVSESGTGDGKGLKFNLPLAPGAGDGELAAIAHRVVGPLLAEFRPELTVLQHGVDGHWGDPLAQLRYTRAGYGVFLDVVREAARAAPGGRLLVTGGGGYAAASVSRILAEAALRIAAPEVERSPTEPLPASWRAEFEREFGPSAPTTWASGVPSGTKGNSSAFEQMLEELGRVHGRTFARAATGPA
jgi:acetoin utilization protein AcuC